MLRKNHQKAKFRAFNPFQMMILTSKPSSNLLRIQMDKGRLSKEEIERLVKEAEKFKRKRQEKEQ